MERREDRLEEIEELLRKDTELLRKQGEEQRREGRELDEIEDDLMPPVFPLPTGMTFVPK
jgi:hypothetical protein